jgi:peptide/nickel transport system substrate-binding protein
MSRSGTTRSSRNYQITSAYQERTIDPDNFYSLVIKSGGPINTTGYSTRRSTPLIDKAAASGDKERAAHLTQIRNEDDLDAPC